MPGTYAYRVTVYKLYYFTHFSLYYWLRILYGCVVQAERLQAQSAYWTDDHTQWFDDFSCA